jgi:hypothetical protein
MAEGMAYHGRIKRQVLNDEWVTVNVAIQARGLSNAGESGRCHHAKAEGGSQVAWARAAEGNIHMLWSRGCGTTILPWGG